MRYSGVFAAIIAGVVATPLLVRDVVTEYAYVTQVVTVTSDAPAPETTTEAVDTTSWWENYFKTHSAKVSQAAASTTQWWDNYFKTHVTHETHTTEAAPTIVPVVNTTPKNVPEIKTTQAEPSPTQTTSTQPEIIVVSSSSTTGSDEPEITETSSSHIPSFKEIVVMHHNIHRRNHSAPDISWDDGLAATALKIANTCQYEHNTVIDNGGYGQNIAAGAPKSNISAVLTELFYNSEMELYSSFYGQANPVISNELFDRLGHFTQMVWKDSTMVGCAVVDCSGRGNGPRGLGLVADSVYPSFTVCNYKPEGNFGGEYGANIGRPLGQPMVRWWYGL